MQLCSTVQEHRQQYLKITAQLHSYVLPFCGMPTMCQFLVLKLGSKGSRWHVLCIYILMICTLKKGERSQNGVLEDLRVPYAGIYPAMTTPTSKPLMPASQTA